MQIDPWLTQIAMLGGASARPPTHWRAVHRHVVADFSTGQSPRYQPGTTSGLPSGRSLSPLARNASNAEVVDYLRKTGPLTVPQLAQAMLIEQPAAWERIHVLQRLGLVRRDNGAWSAALM